MAYQKYLEDLEENYNVNNLSFIEEHILFSKFLSMIIHNDELLNNEEQEELLTFTHLAFKRLENKFKDIEENRRLIKNKYHQYQESHPRLAAYYQSLSLLFLDESVNNDPHFEVTAFTLFFDLLHKIDETYPQQAYEYMKKALDNLY